MTEPLSGVSFYTQAGFSSRGVSRAAQSALDIQTTRRQARASYQAVREFKQSLGQLRDILQAAPAANTMGQTASSGALGLDTVGTASSLTSYQQINNTPQFDTSPGMAGASTSLPTLSGTYTGTTAATFTFRVLAGGSGVLFHLQETTGQMSQVSAPSGYTAGDPITLEDGLQVSFSAGTLAVNDTFTFDVKPLDQVTLDPSEALSSAALEDGFSISDGSFEINGTTIAVYTTDSVNDVVDRINASGAGVTASFDSGDERLQLTSDAEGSDQDITVGNDSSGFLAAFKLGSATQVDGLDPDAERTLDQLAAFSGVSAGTLSVNGVDIAVDPSTDSLKDILARINESDADARAQLSSDGDTVTLRARGTGDNLYLEDDTGLLAALGLESGLLEGVRESTQEAVQGEQALESITRSLENLQAVYGGSLQLSSLSSLSVDITQMLRDALGAEEDATSASVAGLTFDLSEDATAPISVGRGLRAALARGDQSLRDLFLKTDSSNKNLLEKMGDRLDRTEADLRSRYGYLGLMVSASA